MGVITFGTGYAGKVDRVPGLFYVTTKVFQVVNIPLVPLGSFIVREGTEEQSLVAGLHSFEGAPTALSMKSYFWAWARALWFGAALLASIGVLPLVLGFYKMPGFVYLGGMVAGILLLVLWVRSRRGLTATQERAMELAKQLQIPREKVTEAFAKPGLPKAQAIR